MNCWETGARVVRPRYVGQHLSSDIKGGEIMRLTSRTTFKRNLVTLRKEFCEVCGSPGRDVHHKDMMRQDNPMYWDLDRNTNDNIITVCKKCHMDVHKKNIVVCLVI